MAINGFLRGGVGFGSRAAGLLLMGYKELLWSLREVDGMGRLMLDLVLLGMG